MTASSITMTEEDDPSSSSVHLHQQVDAKYQNDNCITADNDTTMDQINTNHQQHQTRLSLIRLESGRQIWWLDNGISSHRAEIMLRRRMRYLQEEQEQQQQQQAELRENYSNNISTDSDIDVGSQSNHEQGGQHNNIIISANSDSNTTSTKEQIKSEVPPTKDIDTATQMKLNTSFASQDVTNSSNTMDAVREVSLESIDEPTLHTYQHQSNQQLIQHCHEQNIPVINVGTILPSSCKKTWMDFGEDNVTDSLSTRQFLTIYASTESDTTLHALDATLSAVRVVDDSSVVNVTLERMSSKGGFTCMLHDPSSISTCASNHHESSCDPLQFQMKHGESQLIQVVWNPIEEGCVRENIELRIKAGEGQEVVRHEIVLVGSARESDNTKHAVEPSNVIIEKEEWNGVSVEYSEIREDGSKHDLNINDIGLTVTEESIECSSIATNGDVTNGLIDSHEVDELSQMMKNASISPKKASMAAKSLSQLSEPKNEDDVASNRSTPSRRVNAKQIMAVQEEIKSGRVFAEENRLISQTSQDFVNGLYMNDKVRHLLDDFDAESVSTDGRRSGRSTPTFGSLSSEEEKCVSNDDSEQLCDDQLVEPEVEAVGEDNMADENTETGGAGAVASQDENRLSSERFNTSTSNHYDKVTVELNALMEDVSDNLQSQSESDDDSNLSPEESDQSHLRDGPQRPRDDQQVEPEVEAVEEDLTADRTETSGASALASEVEYQQSSERLNTRTADHYDKVTAELNALMEDVSDDLQSQSKSDDDSYLSSEESDQSRSESEDDNYLSSGESDQSRDEKVGVFNFGESMSNEENEELNMLPETSIHSSDWDSSGVDTSTDSDQLQNPYKQMSSEMGALMDEFSELEQFAQMQQNYLTSPTTHNFQTQLENINEQIDNFTPSPANATAPKNVVRNTSENRPALRVREIKELKKASEPPTAKAAAKRCYFYKSPRKQKIKASEEASPSEKVSTLLTPSSDVMEEKKEPNKSPFAAVFEAEASSQSNDSMLDSFSPSDGSDSASRPESEGANSSDDILVDSLSLDESFSSAESKFGMSNNTSADLNDDTSTSISSCETSSSISSQNKEMNDVESESLHETRSEQIASLKSKLSSLKSDNNDQYQTPSVSRSQRHSSPTKIPQATSSTRKVQFKSLAAKSLDVSSLKVPVSTSQTSRERQYSSPSKLPQHTPSSRKLQLNTPAHKTLDVASLTASTTSTAQKSARMTYGYFSSQPSTTDRSPANSEVAKTSQLTTKTTLLNTPPPRRATSQLLKTPSSISAYEKHIERMRKSRARNSFS